jgi:hypothetical protein
MKTYYYFLFRIYWFFRDVVKEGHKMSLISTSIASTLFLCFTLYTSIQLSYFFKTSTSADLGLNYKFWILVIGFFLWLINYYAFIKPRIFLKKNFKKDIKGGFACLLFVSALGFLFLIGANKNRDKIFKEREKARIENKK